MASCDKNIVVASTKVKLGVDLCAAKLVGDDFGEEFHLISRKGLRV